MEQVAKKTIEQADIAGLGGGGGTLAVDFVVPGGATRWSLHIVPRDVGGGTDTHSFNLQYGIGGEFLTPNPAAAAALTISDPPTDHVITREDVVHKVRAQFVIPALNRIDGDIDVFLLIDRGGN